MTCSGAPGCWPRSPFALTAGTPTRSWRPTAPSRVHCLQRHSPSTTAATPRRTGAATRPASWTGSLRAWQTPADPPATPRSVDDDPAADRHDVAGPDHVDRRHADPGAAV